MSMFAPDTIEPFPTTRGADGLYTEMIGGRILRSRPAGEEGRRLCFLLGTLLADHLRRERCSDRIIFGPEMHRLGPCSAFLTDLMICSQDTVRLAVNLLPEEGILYSCLDKAFAYREAGTSEYWLIDLPNQFVYCYQFTGEPSFQRISFDQILRSSSYPGFTCCLSDLMLEDGGALRELAVFYRFKKELLPETRQITLAESAGPYRSREEETYTADQFYHWIRSREILPDAESFAELVSGSISPSREPAFRRQYIRGNLYFAIRNILKDAGSAAFLCFSPLAVELTGSGILDSVVRPDLFLISRPEEMQDDVYRGRPLWIAEIVEPATASQVYMDKSQVYNFHGIPEYWIINDWKKQVLVLGADREPAVYDYRDAIPLGSLPGFSITPAEFF